MNYSDHLAARAVVERLHYQRDSSVHDVVRQQAELSPGATALVFGDRSMTYGDLDKLSDALAERLVALGVQKNDIVALFVPRSMETVIAQLAILKAGAAYLPIDVALPTEILDHMISECRPKVVFVTAENRQKIEAVPRLRGAFVDLFHLVGQLPRNAVFNGPRVDGGDTAYLMYTSGSTGRPKGVSVTHRGILRLVMDQNYIDFRRDDVVLHGGSLSFDLTTFEIWSALLNGCTLAGMPDEVFSVPLLCDVIRNRGITITLLTTGLFNLFADFGDARLPSLRHVLFGGEVASPEHARRFLRAHANCRLTNCYGPTEATCIATYFEIPHSFNGHEMPIGRPIAHTGILILDDELAEVPAGTEGQLAITGDGLADGYVQRPDLTEERFRIVRSADGPVRAYLTGDMAVMKDDGTIAFKGRHDRQVKINGKRIELDEIEAALRRDHRLLDGVVVCHEQAPGVRHIVAYLCPKRPSDLTDPEFPRLVMSALRMILPPYMIPSAAVVLKELPLTTAGKVERSKLQPPPVVKSPLVAPQSRDEEIVMRIWREALGVERIAADRNFFDLGGTSLQLLRAHVALEAELGRSIDVLALFQHTTIQELVRYLGNRTGAPVRRMGPDRFAGTGQCRVPELGGES
ncbi:non-ribosomal peptide synthetase [Rhizobium sp. TH2]|uniref:non-ribosomal peptide synthetase n=1 Tax=Rhizobium sp. TH2 TaxID=2775403 RepID=UPI0021572B30|nr:non-ribosomal peptide synthetase [Rhizobium sp. TH2]UVC07733.1 non-ribosomal peptide synthetase [Rhizobium sp. TH2]